MTRPTQMRPWLIKKRGQKKLPGKLFDINSMTGAVDSDFDKREEAEIEFNDRVKEKGFL